MKAFRFTSILIILFLSSVSLKAVEKERIVKKSYKVGDNTELKIKNSFGDVKVESYNGDEIFIEVKIWAKGSSIKKVDKFINSIEIDFDESSDEIEVETSSISNNNKVKKFKVDYTIKMPKGNDLSIDLSFGNVNMGTHKGVVKLDVSHGNIKAKDITNSKNDIELQFGNATINKYSSGKIELQHSNLDINSILDLRLDSQFSNTEIKEVARSINAEVSHGSLNIKSIDSKFENVKIESEFSKINLTMDDRTSYSLEYKGSFTSLTKPSNLEVTNRDKDYTSEEIIGKVNNGGSLVELKMSHSTMEFE
ncbi:MAG: hypothetical protein KAG37_10525 [Flavobacteriales bacterium]|nr:hypothetical protein [Flavobacteriales bacterium]